MSNCQLSEQELEIIKTQLGRTPRGIVKIAHQTPQGIPTVLQTRSLVADKPFPTMYWLCSKDLHKAINEIETSGWTKLIEQRILEDDELRETFYKNHQQYVKARWLAMFPEDKARLEALGYIELFDKYGIGGISQWDKVRCLHMQYAHHLCGENVIGQLMDQEFELNKLAISI
ncbi:DUF501 domain-containing protein [Psychrobium sp. 1_MG-2023]|uniref:DUF501 domain-containing protein n=1 Tax=Psychrobium sp. 1_MG-2023 TaxID=3062624 RepID=UPI000C31BA40|nr:DUF501 domain-containing protein [Psychrobium sp. 1_MG-2023]MDP2561557.1 DUF501 domain-containing protein [Psychrobium sp. 1_MG-2023]PKF55020.1 DUF501 domain-containing protein [Alteromonadales bacterium alter-6D02]